MSLLRRLSKWFTDPDTEVTTSATTPAHLAAAALMVEVARADFHTDDEECQLIVARLQRHLELSAADAEALLQLAVTEVDDATSLFQFTRVINDTHDPEARAQVVDLLWRVAFADGLLDRHEEAIIRRVSDLLYVPHDRFIRGKLAAREDTAAE